MSLSLGLIQLVLTSCLVGLIWLIQLVHYPSFEYISTERFKNFHEFHSMRISWIVMPLMLAELGLAFYWILLERNLFSIFNILLVLIAWLSTFFLSVPLHNKLSQEWNLANIHSLVSTNWIRTLAWTCKSILLVSWMKNFNGLSK